MTPMEAHKDRDDDLEQAWQGRPRRRKVLPDGGVVRVQMNMMDSRSVVDHSASRQFLTFGNGCIPLATDAERKASADLVLAQRDRVSNAWKNPGGRADTADAEQAALASIPGNAVTVKPAPNPTGDAVADARAAYHHRLETAYLKTRPNQVVGSLLGDQS